MGQKVLFIELIKEEEVMKTVLTKQSPTLVFGELQRFSNAADSAAEHSHKNAIRGLALEYGENLQGLLNRVQKFSQSLGPHRVVGALKSQRQKLQ